MFEIQFLAEVVRSIACFSGGCTAALVVKGDVGGCGGGSTGRRVVVVPAELVSALVKAFLGQRSGQREMSAGRSSAAPTAVVPAVNPKPIHTLLIHCVSTIWKQPKKSLIHHEVRFNERAKSRLLTVA